MSVNWVGFKTTAEVEPEVLAMVAQDLIRNGVPVKLEDTDDGVVLKVPEEYADELDKAFNRVVLEVSSVDVNVSADDPIKLVEEFNKRICRTYVPEDEEEYSELSGGGKHGVYDYGLVLWEAGSEMAIAMGMDPREVAKQRVRAVRKCGEGVRIRRIKARELDVEEKR